MTIQTTVDILSFQTATAVGQTAGARAGMEDCYVRPVDGAYAVFQHTETGRTPARVLRRTADGLARAGMTSIAISRMGEGPDHVGFSLPTKA